MGTPGGKTLVGNTSTPSNSPILTGLVLVVNFCYFFFLPTDNKMADASAPLLITIKQLGELLFLLLFKTNNQQVDHSFLKVVDTDSAFFLV